MKNVGCSGGMQGRVAAYNERSKLDDLFRCRLFPLGLFPISKERSSRPANKMTVCICDVVCIRPGLSALKGPRRGTLVNCSVLLGHWRISCGLPLAGTMSLLGCCNRTPEAGEFMNNGSLPPTMCEYSEIKALTSLCPWIIGWLFVITPLSCRSSQGNLLGSLS